MTFICFQKIKISYIATTINKRKQLDIDLKKFS
jgi:hypothetical protein